MSQVQVPVQQGVAQFDQPQIRPNLRVHQLQLQREQVQAQTQPQGQPGGQNQVIQGVQNVQVQGVQSLPGGNKPLHSLLNNYHQPATHIKLLAAFKQIKNS